jgi:hypothetical protein
VRCVLQDGDEITTRSLPRAGASSPTGAAGSRRARTPDPGRGEQDDELERLRKRVGQQDHSLARLSDAVIMLRRGTMALREENRELRMALEASRAGRHAD